VSAAVGKVFVMPVRRLLLSAALAAALAGAVVSPASADPGPPPPLASASEQAAFAAAAQESGVPEALLLALSYAETRWDGHAGQPSASGGYGPMHLVDGAGAARGARGPSVARLSVLQRAAALIDTPRAAVRGDERQNIRAGAALLASYARGLGGGTLPSSIAGWYAAVAKYSGATGVTAAREFADDVYATLRDGAGRLTDDGQALRLAAEPGLRPDRTGLAALHLTPTKTVSAAECPRTLDCRFILAAYARNGSDPTDYGNYDTANRPKDVKIRYIVMHDTEESYDSTVAQFQDPTGYVSAHYVIRSSDGQVTQMVPTKDVAWHAGNWYINTHSIGIEQEGFATQGATWFTEALYRSSARLVRYLAARFNVPLDRAHIIGHDNVPSPNTAHVAGMHWDPGPYWDWAHFMRLLGAPIRSNGWPGSRVVTIRPDFATNQPPVTGCGTPDACPPQPSNFVYLHTAPSDSAPLLTDATLHADGGPGTTRADDTADKAVTGQQFAVADRAPGWIAIWYGGQRGWLRDDWVTRAAVPTWARTVTPRPGLASVPVYGSPDPEPAAYPAQIPMPADSTLPYSIAAGQRYVLGERRTVPTEYYYAKTVDSSLPGDHTVVRGHDRYYLIYFGHRMAYVRAADVVVH
jgi:N-acetylmuramoyl-L-alanine amidase-like protein